MSWSGVIGRHAGFRFLCPLGVRVRLPPPVLGKAFLVRKRFEGALILYDREAR